MEDSFEDYVNTHGDTLLRFAYVLSGDRYLAEDLVQEVLAKIHRRWHRMEHVEQRNAYIRSAIVRQFLSWRRRLSSRERPVSGVPERSGTGPDTANAHADREAMWQMLATLPARQRAVLVLRFYEDMSDAAIAEAVGCREATVRTHAARGLARLRRLLSPASASYLVQPTGGTS